MTKQRSSVCLTIEAKPQRHARQKTADALFVIYKTLVKCVTKVIPFVSQNRARFDSFLSILKISTMHHVVFISFCFVLRFYAMFIVMSSCNVAHVTD